MTHEGQAPPPAPVEVVHEVRVGVLRNAKTTNTRFHAHIALEEEPPDEGYNVEGKWIPTEGCDKARTRGDTLGQYMEEGN